MMLLEKVTRRTLMSCTSRLAAFLAVSKLVSACSPLTATNQMRNMTLSQRAPAAPARLNPPIARRGDHQYSRHGYTLADPYFWLKDQSYPKVDDAQVLDYLKAENAYFDAWLAPYADLKEQIFQELKGRLKDDEESVPSRDGAYDYWWKFRPGAQYRTWYRRPAGKADVGSVLLDEPVLAEGLEYFRLGDLAVSPDDALVAYSADTNGSERFTVRIKDIASGELREDAVENVMGGVVWAADSSGFFYTPVNDNWRPFAVRFHRLGTRTEDDATIYEEADGGFFVGVSQTQSRKWIIISTSDHETSEVRLVPADAPLAAPKLVAAREKGREYDLDEREGTLYIRVNDTHPNFRIVTAPVSAPGEWTELIAGSDRNYLLGLTSFRNLLVISEREDGLDQIRLRTPGGDEHRIAFPEAAYDASLGSNPEYDITRLRLGYTSMVTPQTVYDYHLASRTLETLKVREVPSGYNPDDYATERLMATARDGARVPISIVYKKGFPRDASRPLHLYAYGAYGYAMPPSFSSNRLSLLDRGFAFAIAHIRGGDEMGRNWYLQGRAAQRWNTFHDFVDCARHLVAENYVAAGNISISGGSAGGKLMGVVANTDPQLWRAVAAHVPFVDVLNTMQDESLPLTPMEWPEWGNPITSKAAFELIRSYSPIENVAAKAYPPMLITGGLNDPRVTYWEPAKWAATLRHTKTDNHVVLLKTNMGAGHGGKSGRYDGLYEDAEEYVFLLSQFGLA